MKIQKATDFHEVEQIAAIHLSSFPGFFLTFLGKGFLKYLYKGFILHPDSGILVAKKESRVVGFLAYSTELSQFYSFILKRFFFPFAWYGFLGALRSPKSILRIIRALTYPSAKKTDKKNIEISSIAVDPNVQTKGIGSVLIEQLCEIFKDSEFQVICLETDAENNDAANAFYEKNGFKVENVSETPEGRRMNHYIRHVKG
ncbi:GNAT family N-acetyltransferase [Sphaerochaeta sp. S2]|uniref:GNAT family N-acetyltransferase n=1 Tax=Sphaerochaeta sp. S2 TaxID=2798868 RepID=UPI0018EA29A7|nr:GNAT family N-acetyltransferase [Sphaerochaeta sp. S2]MBJ2357867.1 GNAT family N-acetyltransferase [Sphaerochaeta sp. S2]